MKSKILCIFMMVLLSAAVVFGASQGPPQIRISLLNQDPNPARAGDTVNLRFKVENTGGQPVNNLLVELVEDYPFSVPSGSKAQKIQSLDAQQTGKDSINIEYTVKIDKEAIQGQRVLKLKYSYVDGVWVTVEFSINIKSKEFAQIIYVDKAKLDPGKETNMTFTITNIGNAPLQNMVFSWEEPDGAILPVYSSDTKYVKYLGIGESVDLVYKVIADVNADPGLYQLNLNLNSESLANSNTTSVLSTKAGIFVGGETDFDVAFSESTAGQTSLSVANTGNNPAQSVSVRIPQQESFRVTGTNSAIIGNLDKGDYTLVSFQIVPASTFNATGASTGQRRTTSTQTAQQAAQIPRQANNNLKVTIDYTDTTGERRSVEKSVPIQFRSATSLTTTNLAGRSSTSSCIGSTYFWLLVIAVVIVVVVFVMNRRTKALVNRKK